MKDFRNTLCAKLIVWIMLLSITLVSCDPKGDLLNNYKFDNAIEKQLEAMKSMYSTEDCQKAQQMLIKAKNYVWAKSKIGLVSRADVLNFLIDEGIANGQLQNVSQNERNLLVNAFSNDVFFLNNGESLDPMYGFLELDGRVTAEEREFLTNLEDNLINLTTEAEIIEVFNTTRNNMLTLNSLSSNFKHALNMGFDQAELAMCADLVEKNAPSAEALSTSSSGEIQSSSAALDSRCEIWTCVTEYTWVIKIITVVIAVVAIILAIFTFGFSLLLVTVTFAAWVLVPIIVCAFIPCPEADCPEGQNLTCMTGFTLNSDNVCFAEGYSFVGGGVFSETGTNGNCPNGGFFTGGGGVLDCAHGPISNFNGGIFSGLVDGEDYWADSEGAYHLPVCN